jgi:tetratricopeptide (TPR) repeat protein
MAIISRGAGVALLLIGLALSSGNTRAAGPSYDDYIAQVKAGKIEIDHTAFRLAYAASSKYAPYGTIQIVSQMKKAYDAGDCPSAMAHAEEAFEVNFLQMDAHKIAAFCLKKAGNEEEARRHYAMFLGLFSSVLKSGDGLSPETAFVVIAVDEEYNVLETASFTPVKQERVNHGGSAFDRFEVKLPESDRTATLFFNVDRPHAQLARTLQKKQ